MSKFYQPTISERFSEIAQKESQLEGFVKARIAFAHDLNDLYIEREIHTGWKLSERIRNCEDGIKDARHNELLIKEEIADCKTNLYAAMEAKKLREVVTV